MPIYTHKDISKLASYVPQNSGVFIIIDKQLAKYFPEFKGIPLIKITASEKNKTLETVAFIEDRLFRLGADRDCFLLGVGGGVITDITGFVAATYKRGVRFALVPTTLLAQVDAAIGGKNGLNLNGYKNAIGTFKMPDFIYQSPRFLQTLTQRVFSDGVAEVLKTFLLYDETYYKKALAFFKDFRFKTRKTDDFSQEPGYEKNVKKLKDIIAQCAFYKNAVVQKDTYDMGSRRLLNFGHTFGHAIEKCTNDNPDTHTIMHGEAVAIGMVMAAKIAYAAGHCNKKYVTALIEDLASIGLPTQTDIKLNSLLKIVKDDKKVTGSKIRFIMPYSIGDVRVELIELTDFYDLCKKAFSNNNAY